MKHRRFRWILYAMTIVLTGVICLQAYWLDKAVSLERMSYRDNVRDAMRKATAKMESGEAFNLITNEFLPPPGLIEKDCVIVRTDSGKTIHIVHNKVPHAPPFPPHPPAPGQLPELLIGDSFTASMDTGNQMVIMRKEERMKTAVKGALMQYVFRRGSAIDRLTKKQIEDALAESFKNNEIEESFEFAVNDPLGKKHVFVSDSLRLKEFDNASFRVPLFPSDIDPKGDELLVLMNDHHAKILRALWPQFLISILFTISLILVFFITFREALKQKKISEIRNDFINNMTHEFKTPIATISLAADTVMNEAVIHDPESVRKYSEIIKRENRRMNDQVEKVLELALTEKKELSVVSEPVQLNELLLRLINVMSLQAAARDGKIEFSGTDHPIVISGDAFHLERVFLNLFDNAIKYSKSQPKIEVNLYEKDNAAVVEITDNGIGIPGDEQKRIFDRFYRVSTGDLHNVKGFGLGLSYVKTIVELHGGKIEVESKPGKGSTFRIIFKK
jgi:two-component system phosphate regulon sensor histidine kinase PhoR